MRKLLLSVGAGLIASAGAFSSGSGAAAVPVLVELFTSEGCSSCPPADRVLAKLDKDQPVPGAEVIVLSEHVDYWNQLGWADPYSSALYSSRQREYARRLGGEVYTPEAVVDGAQGMVGSEEKDLRDAIRRAAASPKSPLMVSGARDGDKVNLTITGGALKGELFVAVARDSAETQVLRGENSGRHLAHVAVVNAVQSAGKLDGHGELSRTITVKAAAASRVVVWVNSGGHVTALGHTKV